MTTLTMIKKNYAQGLKDFANVSIAQKNYVSLYKQELENTVLLSNSHIIIEVNKYVFNNIISTLPAKYQNFYNDFKEFKLKKILYDIDEGSFTKGKVTALIMNTINTFSTDSLRKRVCNISNNDDGKYCYINDIYFNIVKHFSATDNMICSKDKKCIIFKDKATNCRALIMCIYTPSFEIKNEIAQELGIELD